MELNKIFKATSTWLVIMGIITFYGAAYMMYLLFAVDSITNSAMIPEQTRKLLGASPAGDGAIFYHSLITLVHAVLMLISGAFGIKNYNQTSKYDWFIKAGVLMFAVKSALDFFPWPISLGFELNDIITSYIPQALYLYFAFQFKKMHEDDLSS